MNINASEQRVDAYLDAVSDALSDLPEHERVEILGDLEAHIADSLGVEVRFALESDVLNTLERLGPPREVAREARELRGHADQPSQTQDEPRRNPYADQHRSTPGALEIGAIVLTALMWPIGILLTWLSARWKTRSKVIATVIPVTSALILAVIAIAGTMIWETSGVTSTVVSDAPAIPSGDAPPQDPVQTEPRSPSDLSDSSGGDGILSRMVVVIVFLGGAVAGPFVAAVYLAIKLQPASRPVAASSV
jgi:uncharacterized membrane protein